VTIAVTGTSGGVGSRVARSLLDIGCDQPVVALTRTPEAIPNLPGLTARRADYECPSSLRAALRAVDTLVFISSDGVAEAVRRHHANVLSAAIGASVGHVVYTSILDVSPHSGFYYAPVHRETETMLVDSGIGCSLARTSIFADYFVSAWLAPALADGTLAVPAGSGRMSLVSRDDTARALAALTLERMPVIVELTGPEALTAGDICQITRDATGGELRYLAVDESSYRDRMARNGAADWLFEAYSSMFASVRRGRFETVCTDGPGLTGAPQQTYAEFLATTPLARGATGQPSSSASRRSRKRRSASE
jgi:NAD(P)H dehydrogenase (quinone)